MNMYKAISERRSVRKYHMEPVEETIIDRIFQFLEEAESLFPDIKTEIKVIDAWNQKQKFFGITNVSAPHYIAIYTEEKEKSEMKAGYVMQQIALYLTSKGLGTCYQGMAKKKDEEMEQENLSCIMVMAFGYPKGKMLRQKGESKRLPMEELCAFKEEPKCQVKELLEAARIAPSSWNSQPWRFAVYENRFHIFSKKPFIGQRRKNHYNEFNFGVLLANIMEAAEELWIDVEVIRLDNITHIALPNNEYVISIILQ